MGGFTVGHLTTHGDKELEQAKEELDYQNGSGGVPHYER